MHEICKSSGLTISLLQRLTRNTDKSKITYVYTGPEYIHDCETALIVKQMGKKLEKGVTKRSRGYTTYLDFFGGLECDYGIS